VFSPHSSSPALLQGPALRVANPVLLQRELAQALDVLFTYYSKGRGGSGGSSSSSPESSQAQHLDQLRFLRVLRDAQLLHNNLDFASHVQFGFRIPSWRTCDARVTHSLSSGASLEQTGHAARALLTRAAHACSCCAPWLTPSLSAARLPTDKRKSRREQQQHIAWRCWRCGTSASGGGAMAATVEWDDLVWAGSTRAWGGAEGAILDGSVQTHVSFVPFVPMPTPSIHAHAAPMPMQPPCPCSPHAHAPPSPSSLADSLQGVRHEGFCSEMTFLCTACC
jgi:hypothetical protein